MAIEVVVFAGHGTVIKKNYLSDTRIGVQMNIFSWFSTSWKMACSTTMHRYGERAHPCQMPANWTCQSEDSAPSLTLNNRPSLINLMIPIICAGRLILSSVWINILRLMQSTACFQSRQMRNGGFHGASAKSWILLRRYREEFVCSA